VLKINWTIFKELTCRHSFIRDGLHDGPKSESAYLFHSMMLKTLNMQEKQWFSGIVNDIYTNKNICNQVFTVTMLNILVH